MFTSEWMITDQHLQWVGDLVKVLVGAIVGALAAKRFEGRAKLITRWGHISAFSTKVGDQLHTLHTHEVVIRNAGRKEAHNVRVTHTVLPDFNVAPSVPFIVEDLPDGRKDIVFPVVVPGLQLTIAYLYSPPLLYSQVHAGIRSDEVLAKAVDTEIQEKYPLWFTVFAGGGFVVGCGTILYWLWLGASWLGL